MDACLACWAFIGFACTAFFVKAWQRMRTGASLKGRHVLIVGGSTGIGRAVAERAALLGATVVIAARDPAKLRRAEAELGALPCRVHTVSVDVAAGAEEVERGIAEAVRKAGPIFMLVNCAGTAICGRLEDMLVKDIQFLTDLNFLGSVWLARAVLPQMKERREGHIVFVSTQAAMLGVYGYSAYGATKWAVRGLGEALMMETVGTGVKVTISFPPDTDTPGFELEETSKPPETKIISGGGGLYKPQEVAEKLLRDALRGNPYSTVGLEGWMLTSMCGTTSNGFFDTIVNATLMPALRLILMGYEYYFHYVITKCRRERNTNKKAN